MKLVWLIGVLGLRGVFIGWLTLMLWGEAFGYEIIGILLFNTYWGWFGIATLLTGDTIVLLLYGDGEGCEDCWNISELFTVFGIAVLLYITVLAEYTEFGGGKREFEWRVTGEDCNTFCCTIAGGWIIVEEGIAFGGPCNTTLLLFGRRADSPIKDWVGMLSLLLALFVFTTLFGNNVWLLLLFELSKASKYLGKLLFKDAISIIFIIYYYYMLVYF